MLRRPRFFRGAHKKLWKRPESFEAPTNSSLEQMPPNPISRNCRSTSFESCTSPFTVWKSEPADNVLLHPPEWGSVFRKNAFSSFSEARCQLLRSHYILPRQPRSYSHFVNTLGTVAPAIEPIVIRPTRCPSIYGTPGNLTSRAHA